LSPIKAPKSPTLSQFVPADTSNGAVNFEEEVDRIERSPVDVRVPAVKLERSDSITLLRQSNEEFLAAARRVKTTTPDKMRLSPSPLKLPSLQSSPKNTKVNSSPILPTRFPRSNALVPRRLETEFEEEIEDIVESEEQVKYKESTLMVSNLEEIDAAFKGDDIEDDIDFSPEPLGAAPKFSPLVRNQNEMLKHMKGTMKAPAITALHDSIEESIDSQHLDEMLTMESTHRTPTKSSPTQQRDVEDIEEADGADEQAFERSNSPLAEQLEYEDYIADSPEHVPENLPIQPGSPDVFENKNLRLLVDDVDDADNGDDIFVTTFKEENDVSAAPTIVAPIKFSTVNIRTPDSQPQQPASWNTADKIRGSFISPVKRTQLPAVFKEGLRIRPLQGTAPPDQTFLNKISVNSGQFTQFVPNEENTGRKGLAHLVKYAHSTIPNKLS